MTRPRLTGPQRIRRDLLRRLLRSVERGRATVVSATTVAETVDVTSWDDTFRRIEPTGRVTTTLVIEHPSGQRHCRPRGVGHKAASR